MDPTIYKPSIYKGAGIYKTGEGSGGGGEYALIGGRSYRTCRIGGQTWLAENLDFVFNGVSINPGGWPTNPAAFYQNNSYRQTYGLLYNWYAVNLLETNKSQLIPGWHVPTKAEFETLISTIGGNSQATGTMRDSSWGGDNRWGFSALPSGYYNDSNFLHINNLTDFWTATEYNTSSAYFWQLRPDHAGLDDIDKRNGFVLRLVKD